MGKCAICNTPGVNKSTCPLKVKNPTESNWKKHYLAKKPTVVTTKPKRTPKSTPTIKQPVSIGRTPPVKQLLNPYVKHARETNLVKQRMFISFKTAKNIILNGTDLKHFYINIKEPEKLTIRLPKTSKNLKNIQEHLNLISDIIIRISQQIVTRQDFYTNQNEATQSLFKILTETKNSLLNYIVENNDGPSGGGVYKLPSYTAPLDEMIKDLDKLAEDDLISKLQSISIPTSLPKIKKKETGKEYAGLKGKKTRRHRHRRNKHRHTHKYTRK